MTKKEMPGYTASMQALKAEQLKQAQEKLAKEAREKEQKIKDEETRKTGKKGLYILKEDLKHSSVFSDFLATFFVVEMSYFLLGSLAWLVSVNHVGADDNARFNSAQDAESADFSWSSPTYHIYGDMSYKQAIKNAYLWDDFRNGNGGLFQGICGLLTILIGLGIATAFAKDSAKKVFKEKTQKHFQQLEQLKDYGIDANKLISQMEPYVIKLISKMSEIDRGYFDNLISGGLDKANYQTCMDVVAGHLKSHPEDYNKLVEIIDENTLPEDIKKKYGKTISFGAAKVMIPER